MYELILNAIILGVVEGVTEFLPISSTGHLIIVNHWITFSESFTKVFDVVIQLGAILAVVLFFWSTLWPFSKDVLKRAEVASLWKKTLLAVVPALIIGGLFGSAIQQVLFTPWVVATALIVGGVILVLVERREVATHFETVSEISWRTALWIGLIQCLSMIPGTSRAAATIIGGRLLGASRVAAVEFSFFLAIPTMVAAAGYSLLKHGGNMSSAEWATLIVGFVTSFIVALGVIKFLMKYIQSHTMRMFGYYRIALGVIVILYLIASA